TDRLLEREVHAAGDRDLVAGETLGRGRVVVEDVADVAGLPAGVADRVPGVADLQARQVLPVGVHGAREGPEQLGPCTRGDTAPGGERRPRPGDGLIDLGDAGQRDVPDDALVDGADDVQCRAHRAPSLSASPGVPRRGGLSNGTAAGGMSTGPRAFRGT